MSWLNGVCGMVGEGKKKKTSWNRKRSVICDLCPWGRVFRVVRAKCAGGAVRENGDVGELGYAWRICLAYPHFNLCCASICYMPEQRTTFFSSISRKMAKRTIGRSLVRGRVPKNSSGNGPYKCRLSFE